MKRVPHLFNWIAMAWNSPDRGNRNSGPPDLDELWRRFNAKLAGLFGGKPGDPGAPGRPYGGLGLIAAIVVAVWLASGFYIVDEGKRGVVLRFGKYIETTLSGPRWHLPYPIETVEIVNTEQVRTVEVGYRNNVRNKNPLESLMLTDDGNIIDIQFAVQYTIKDPEDYLFNNRETEAAVLQVAETAIREVVGKNKMDFVLYEGRSEIAARAHRLMQAILDRYGIGVNISKVSMQDAQPPEQVQAAFNDAVKAKQDRERAINEGQAYANDVIPRARGTASRLMQEANGYRQRVVASAEGDASRFQQIVVEYNKAPGVTRERLYIDAMQQILSNTNKVLVEQKSGSMIYLPLDKLIGNSAAPLTNSEATRAPATSDAGSASESLSRSREALRSREREARP